MPDDVATPVQNADWPADWKDVDIHQIAASSDGHYESTLVHLRFACREWRKERINREALTAALTEIRDRAEYGRETRRIYRSAANALEDAAAVYSHPDMAEEPQ